VGDAAWRNRLAAYYALARKELARFRGREIDTAGDGLFATFDGPARAVRCALAIVEGIKQLGLEVRAGLHTGECELMDDAARVGGLAVHIGARVLAQAGPSEVLVSSAVRELVVGSGLKFQARAPRALKGVPGEWQLYAAQG
jgi:class 3 adenylate cyclase